MNREKKDVLRAQEVIGIDRLMFDENFEKVFLKDFEKIIGEYFVCKKSPSITVSKNSGSFTVDVKFIAERVKSFGMLTK